MLLADVHVLFLEDISRVLIKMLSIIVNLNKAAHILGLQLTLSHAGEGGFLALSDFASATTPRVINRGC